MKSPIRSCLLTAFLAQALVCQAVEASELPNSAVKTRCAVNSSVYNRPMLKGPGNNVPVPLSDGAQVSISKSASGISKIEITPGPVFRRCSEKPYLISDINHAKAVLEFTQIEDPEAFVGSELTVCYTVDEGWYIVVGKKTAYIGYAGPMEKPVAFVGMVCD